MFDKDKMEIGSREEEEKEKKHMKNTVRNGDLKDEGNEGKREGAQIDTYHM